MIWLFQQQKEFVRKRSSMLDISKTSGIHVFAASTALCHLGEKSYKFVHQGGQKGRWKSKLGGNNERGKGVG